MLKLSLIFYQVFDRDSSGSLSVPELRHVLSNLGEKLIDHEMNEFLQHCDGEVISIDGNYYLTLFLLDLISLIM